MESFLYCVPVVWLVAVEEGRPGLVEDLLVFAYEGFFEEVYVDSFVFYSVGVPAESEVDEYWLIVLDDDVARCEVTVVDIVVVDGCEGVTNGFHDAWIILYVFREECAIDVFGGDGVIVVARGDVRGAGEA